MSSVTLFLKKHLIIRKRTRLLENATMLMIGSFGFCIRMEIKKLPNLMVEGFTEGMDLTTGESKMSLSAK
jgi:hypothetical protein